MKFFKKLKQMLADKARTNDPKSPQNRNLNDGHNDGHNDGYGDEQNNAKSDAKKPKMATPKQSGTGMRQSQRQGQNQNSPGAHPICDDIMIFLDAQNWKYEHKSSQINVDGHGIMPQIHHLIVPFHDKEAEWTCVFRINERTQLVSIFGVLPDVTPQSHFAPMMMAISMANLSIPFGSLELDPTDGEVRTKISFDAEFMPISDQALGCHLQGLASLTELAQRTFDDVMAESEPSPILLDYLNFIQDSFMGHHDDHTASGEIDLAGGQFFEPTDRYQ